MMHDFVVDNEIGFAVNTEDKNDFANRVIEIAKDYAGVSKTIEEKSKQLIGSQKIFWDQTVTVMLDAYSKLVTE